MTQHIVLFRGKEIRKEMRNSEWHFSVIDVIEVLIILAGMDAHGESRTILVRPLAEFI